MVMSSSRTRLQSLLSLCLAGGASDLHLSPGQPPHLRLHGELAAVLDQPAFTADEVHAMAAELSPELSGSIPRGSVDGALTGDCGARFRFNVFRSGGSLSIAIRRLEERFRTLEELGMPESLLTFCGMRDGLVIVSGPTGAGKSTTLATLLDHVNRTRSGHIITIEDPVEYIHAPVRCLVHQRQIGPDASGFNEALVASLRQDPDVILVGEIRDLETIRTAIAAAETGHLVFTTLHAGDCAGSVERLVSVFPADEQDGIRRQLALVLRGIVSQRLLPPDGGGRERVAASEVLVNTPAVANLIATGRTSQIYSAIESGASAGMQTFEQDLARLWTSRRISEMSAFAMARNPAILRDRAASLRAHGTGGTR